MPLKAIKSINQSKPAPSGFLQKLDSHLAEAVGNTIKYQGQVFNVGVPEKGQTIPGDAPGKFIEIPGRKPLYGVGGRVAGYINPDGSVQISGSGSEAPEDSKKRFYLPKSVGVDVTWEDPKAGGRHAMDDRGTGRQGYFFPFAADDKPCIQCGGKGFMKDEIVAPTKPGQEPKPKTCDTCKGIGRFVRKAEAFARSMSAMGQKPQIRPARGKTRLFPIAPSAAGDAQQAPPAQ